MLEIDPYRLRQFFSLFTIIQATKAPFVGTSCWYFVYLMTNDKKERGYMHTCKEILRRSRTITSFFFLSFFFQIRWCNRTFRCPCVAGKSSHFSSFLIIHWSPFNVSGRFFSFKNGLHVLSFFFRSNYIATENKQTCTCFKSHLGIKWSNPHLFKLCLLKIGSLFHSRWKEGVLLRKICMEQIISQKNFSNIGKMCSLAAKF